MAGRKDQPSMKVVKVIWPGLSIQRNFFYRKKLLIFACLLSFKKFCISIDIEGILERVHLFGESPEEEYKQLEEAYRIYRHIGGYPQVVTTYIKTKDENGCMVILGDLIRTFTAELSRFFSNSMALSIFSEVYKSILVQMAEQKREAINLL
jgi:hypothetical protein